jgi:hypothetical protein
MFHLRVPPPALAPAGIPVTVVVTPDRFLVSHLFLRTLIVTTLGCRPKVRCVRLRQRGLGPKRSGSEPHLDFELRRCLMIFGTVNCGCSVRVVLLSVMQAKRGRQSLELMGPGSCTRGSWRQSLELWAPGS